MQENTAESATILKREGNPNYVLNLKLDTYTDALMINTAYSIDSSSPLQSVLLARKNYIPGKTKTVYEDVNGELISAKEAKFDILNELIETTEGNIETSFEYARYWHGYIVFLRPLLMLFNVSEIKILVGMLLAILAIYLILQLRKRIEEKYCRSNYFGTSSNRLFPYGANIPRSYDFYYTVWLFP